MLRVSSFSLNGNVAFPTCSCFPLSITLTVLPLTVIVHSPLPYDVVNFILCATMEMSSMKQGHRHPEGMPEATNLGFIDK